MATIEIVPVIDKAGLKAFIALPKRLYAGSNGYVPPLDMERKEVLSPIKNFILRMPKRSSFSAKNDGKVVGRISAQICQLEQKLRPGTGHFGWLDAEDDPAIYQAPTEKRSRLAAPTWLHTYTGPLSFCTNEETGSLVDGFDHLPMLMMPYHAPHAGRNVEAAGFSKLKDVVVGGTISIRPFISPRLVAHARGKLSGRGHNPYARIRYEVLRSGSWCHP